MADGPKLGGSRVAVLGCGNVGDALVEVLITRREEITARTGLVFDLAGIAVNDLAKPRSEYIPVELLTDDAKGLVEREDVDVVVELIGGLDPARALVEASLRAGKSVITGNKVLMAAHGAELSALAQNCGVDLLYEASVAGAIPVIRALRQSLAGERVVRLMGIVNGTTNFILTKMADEGASYSDALAEAQRLGYAERDPSADVEGTDAACKATILANLAFAVDVAVGDVHCEGIANVSEEDVAFAAQLGYVVKLLAVAERLDPEGDRAVISVRVHPAMIHRDHPLAAVRGSFNAVFVDGTGAGELMFYGRGAGGWETASAVLGDLIDATRNQLTNAPAPAPTRMHARMVPMSELSSAFYFSIYVADRPGVLAAVSTVFGDHGISIRSMEQIGLGDEARLVFVTHEASEAAVVATLADLRELPAVDTVGQVLRVVGVPS